MATARHIGIIGGGVAGLFTAWYLSRNGQKVTLYEAETLFGGTSSRAAGMLAPVNETEFGELEILRAGLASRALYDEVEAALGDIGLNRSGTLDIALEDDDVGYLQRLYAYQQEQGLSVKWLKSTEITEYEPFLSRHVPAAIWSPEDIQVDQLALMRVLVADCRRMGAVLHENTPVLGWESTANTAKVFGGDFESILDQLIVAVGVPGKSLDLPYKIYPVRGEMIALEPPGGEFLSKTVRIRNKTWGNGYIVPKENRILLGSTSEEKGLDARNTAGGWLDILRRAYAAVPGVYELPVLDSWAGLRPATLSRMPIVDVEENGIIFHLNGLYRHGILLGPLAGKAMAQLVLSGSRMPEIEAFRLSEF